MALPTILCSQARKSAWDTLDATEMCAKPREARSAAAGLEDRRKFLFVSPLSSCSTAAPESPIVAAPEDSMLSMFDDMDHDKPQPALHLDATGLLRRHVLLHDEEDEDEIFQGHALWSTPDCMLRYPSFDGENQEETEEEDEEIFQGHALWRTPACLRSPASSDDEMNQEEEEDDGEEDDELFRGMPLWHYSGPSLEESLRAELEKAMMIAEVVAQQAKS